MMNKIHITNEEEEIIISGDDTCFFPIWEEGHKAIRAQVLEGYFNPNFTVEFFSYKKGKEE